MRYSRLLLIIIILLRPAACYPQTEEVKLEPILILPEAAPAGRSVEVIEPDEFQAYSVSNIAQALKDSSVDLQKRGPGAQSDLSIRGGSFEQVLILIDGSRANDPQTGHFHLDIPIPLDEVQRIEIIRGPYSSFYGANAFGGVVNIITKRPKKPFVSFEASYGQENTYDLSASASGSINNLGLGASFQKEKSDGQRPDTDYDVLNFAINSILDFSSGWLKTLFGYQDKQFGAFDFYTPDRNFPSREKTNTRFVNINSSVQISGLTFEPTFYFRRHDDKFVLDRDRPGILTNYHTTYSYGTGTVVKFGLFGDNDFSIGQEINFERISSSNLGGHRNKTFSIFADENIRYKRFDINPSIRLDHHCEYGNQVSPSLGAAFKASEKINLRANIASGFRPPSFTELYYTDPSNRGDPDLKPEHTLSYEAGIDADISDSLRAGLTVFYRDEKDLIDWVKSSPSDLVWQAKNIGKIITQGLEPYMEFSPANGTKFNLQYTYLRRIQKDGYISKYILRHPRHEVVAALSQDLPYQFKAGLSLTYKKRPRERDYTILDGKLSKEIKNLQIFFEITNILNSKYYDVLGVPGSRRWIKAGSRITF